MFERNINKIFFQSDNLQYISLYHNSMVVEFTITYAMML
jgi:hypothetical protein